MPELGWEVPAAAQTLHRDDPAALYWPAWHCWQVAPDWARDEPLDIPGGQSVHNTRLDENLPAAQSAHIDEPAEPAAVPSAQADLERVVAAGLAMRWFRAFRGTWLYQLQGGPIGGPLTKMFLSFL